MREILFLVHRFPYPPNKGDKIRSYHILKKLSEHYRVHLGCFIDDPDDQKYVDELLALCESAKILPLNPLLSRIKSLWGFFAGESLSVHYYFNREMAGWVEGLLQSGKVSSIIVYSSPMGQYALGSSAKDIRRVMDFVDVDSDKWRQYSERKSWPLSFIYKREADHLAEFEMLVAERFDASSFVTENEVQLFNSISSKTAEKHHVIQNGVATDYFDPGLQFDSPFSNDALPVVFTGMMDYWANVDAVSWFTEEVWQKVRLKEPRAEFWIVGASPVRDVLNLSKLEGVHVTGRVPDIRPYLKYASLVVAPLRISRGVQNKVLEALSMGCRTVCTKQVAAGLVNPDSAPLFVATDARDMEGRIIELLSLDGGEGPVESARHYVLDNYLWEKSLDLLDQLV
ncbi:MAG: TIGR03087 family PEP-CTERM/XrtA system glycosyltransferase [Gammaproteobacteria bacterium]|nr:TIGR03087 family PEP-CTERM/XrtA system glycosyltransferase [Gammaproteobacteria bacterium]